MRKLRLIIADDHSMVRQGVKGVIASQKSWELCGEAEDGKAAVELAKRVRPDIAILDISMPGLNGLETIKCFKAELPSTKLLILTMHDSEALADEALIAGAHGYLLKSDAADLLPRAIGALAAGKNFLTTKITWHESPGTSEDPNSSSDSAPKFRLSPREREIVRLAAEGKMNKEIAKALGISVGTVETHRKNIFGKLQFRSAVDLVRYAVRNNLVDL